MAYMFYTIMQKRKGGVVYCDLHKTDEHMYLNESEAKDKLAAYGTLQDNFHVVPIVGQLEVEYDDMCSSISDLETRLESATQDLALSEETNDSLHYGIEQQADKIRELEEQVAFLETVAS